MMSTVCTGVSVFVCVCVCRGGREAGGEISRESGWGNDNDSCI